MNSITYYEVLGCNRESSYEDLKKNYRKLVLQHHPDKIDTAGDQDADKFNQIEEAWKVLRDADSRRKYDLECRQAQIDAQSILVHATITANEMEVTVDDDTLSYQCRCGSYYLAERAELLPRNCTLHIPCQECTFILVVET